MPSGCGSSSHHFQTSCSSSFFFRPPLAGDAPAAAAPFLGEGTSFVAPPLFFFGGVAATFGLATAAALLLDVVGVFFDFLGYKRTNACIYRRSRCTKISYITLLLDTMLKFMCAYGKGRQRLQLHHAYLNVGR